MRSHLQLLGILQLVWGAIGLLLGVSTLMLAAGAAAIGLTSSGYRDRRRASPPRRSSSFAVALLAGGLANAWAGRALRRRSRHGRLVDARARGAQSVRAAVRHRAGHLRVLGAAARRDARALRGTA